MRYCTAEMHRNQLISYNIFNQMYSLFFQQNNGRGAHTLQLVLYTLFGHFGCV